MNNLKLGVHLISRLFFPPHCVLCDQEIFELPDENNLCNGYFCPECSEALLVPDWPGCPFCAAHLSGSPPIRSRCVYCDKEKLNFDRVLTLGKYDGILREAILKIKKPQQQVLTFALTDSLCYLRRDLIDDLGGQAIVPIPMNPQRRKERDGINDTELIAERLGLQLGLPVRYWLTRQSNTKLQRALKPNERRKNVEGAFEINDLLWDSSETLPENILLVDDVLTTGSTCSEAANILKQSGAKKVYVLVLARATGV